MIQYPILSIAGFDNSGGAGLQADLKVFTGYGCYGMTVVTAIAVQNTTGVKSCHKLSKNVIQEQLESIFEDIPPKAIKIGMLFDDEIITTVGNFLEKNATDIPIILDPVMVAKSGDALLVSEAVNSLRDKLIPLAEIITPNLPEAFTLLGKTSQEALSQKGIAEQLLKLGSHSVLVKGGHYDSETSDDLFLDQEGVLEIFTEKRIQTKNTHGTGCTLSSAIAAGIARGESVKNSILHAKKYLTYALKSAVSKNVGLGIGPTDHTWFLEEPCNGKLN